jgi:hypothetical protein
LEVKGRKPDTKDPGEVEEGIEALGGNVQASNRLENSLPAQAEGAKFELRRGIIIEPVAEAGP